MERALLVVRLWLVLFAALTSDALAQRQRAGKCVVAAMTSSLGSDAVERN